MKYENAHGTPNEKMADNLLEKAWINDDPKYIKELITLIESKKLNGNTLRFKKCFPLNNVSNQN